MVSSAQVTEMPLHWHGEDRCPTRHDGMESNTGSCFRIFRGLWVTCVSHQWIYNSEGCGPGNAEEG